MSLIHSARDLRFLLYDWLKVEDLCATQQYSDHSRETFDALLELSEQLATREFAPHNALSDQNEPTFDGTRVRIIPQVKEALDAFNAAGMSLAGVGSDLGGFQVPESVQRACFMWFQAANTGTSGYPLLSIAALKLLAAHASADLIERFARPIGEGRFFGIMCLSEPDVGSSLGDVTTRAFPAGDGTHRLFGTKMWISAGEHDLSENIIALVLARYDRGPAGVSGLSLYAVPKWLVNDDGTLGERNAISLVGLNHKMGYRGTVNTILEFGADNLTPGGQAGAVGYLIGEEGHGLAYMFHMMNEARIAVGAGAAALGYTSYLHALAYAKQRPQGRLGKGDPTTPMVPIIEHADVRRMLLASKSYVEGATALVLYAGRLVDAQLTADSETEKRELGLLLDVLTPIVKTWPSIWGLVACDHAIQVHGGYGYSREFPVEQFWRDNRLNPIHEGTHGIQAKDLLGRKVGMKNGAAFTLLLQRITETTTRAKHAHPEWASQLGHATQRAEETTSRLLAIHDHEIRLANAFHYLEAIGHIVIAWLWLDQTLVATNQDDRLHRGKHAAAAYFFQYELPKVHTWLDLLDSDTTLLVDLDVTTL